MNNTNERHDIAIIGLSCRFPQAPDPEQFWQLIASGQSVFQTMPENRTSRHASENLDGMKGAFLENPYLFDNERFGIPDAEAEYMDPQQRIMLELAVEAMENAGYSDWANLPAGVFIGADQLAYQEMITSGFYRRKAADYLLQSAGFQNIPPEYRKALEEEIETMRATTPLPPNALVGNLTNMIAGRISHELNLKGPAMSVDTACSSSLVAVHLACESLNRHECDRALAGGVNLNLTPSVFQYMKAAGVISPSGKCIPFSNDSDGILLGEGGGMVVLRRLEDALRDKNPIWAIIRGSGINNDGRTLGLMAPAWKGQLALLQSTYERSGFDPAKISALETHGTSTRIGDGVELSVIEKFFPISPEKPLSIGSVKSNFGHTLAASGIAGLLKMVMAIHHKKLPPTIHEALDPNKKLAEKGIRVQSVLADWAGEKPRCAGVSSFGFGGTNVHLILEEPEQVPVFHPAPPSITARKSFFHEFFPQLAPQNETVTTIGWEERPLQIASPDFAPPQWLLLGFDQHELQQLQQALHLQGKAVYQALCLPANTPAAFTRTGEHDFCIDPANADHYRWLIASIPPETALGVVLMAGQMPDAPPADFVGQTLTGFRFLLQTIKKRGESKIWVATNSAYRLNAGEKSRPNQRALAVLAAGALEENPELRGGVIDQGDTPDAAAVLASMLGVTASVPVIIRGSRQFLPVLKPLKTTGTTNPGRQIKLGGTYLVIGGSSGIGALLAERFVQQSARKVIITGTRSADRLPESLKALLSDRLIYLQSDVLQKASMAAMIAEVYEKYGEPDGIVYAAGSIGFGGLLQKKQEDFERVLLAKMAGATYLSECLKDRHAGFVYVMSSVSGLAPVWSGGMADYAAANAFLDAMAEGSASWISCSWGLWQNTGMAAGAASGGFTPEEGLATFSATLSAGRSHVVALPKTISAHFSSQFSAKKAIVQPLEKIDIQPFTTNGTQTKEPPAAANNGAAPKPPEVATPVVNSPSQQDVHLVQTLKTLIADAVQMPPEKIDETASFYQLGLDSLSAVDVAQQIEAFTGKVLHPTILFEHDTIAALAAYLQPTGETAAPVFAEPVLPASDTDRFPLIGSQKTFYAQQLFYPEKPCNVLVNITLAQPLESSILQAALDFLIAKHDALRLAFEMTGEGPRQYVLNKLEVAVSFQEYTDEQAVLALENELVNQVFDLEKPPFFRLTHVTWSGRHAALMLTMHHLIFDAWSMYVLLQELLTVYEQLARGETPTDNQPAASFREYVAFHEQSLAQRETNGLKAYWAGALDNAVWGLPLPYKQVKGSTSRYCMVMGELGPATTARFMEENQKQRQSDFHALLAALFLTLRQQTGRPDMVVRVANANRDAAFPGIATMTGCLADALPLRLELQAGEGPVEVARRLKPKMMEALRHTGLSSQDIAELPIGRQDDGPVVLSPVGLSFVPMHHLGKGSLMPVQNIRCRTALPFTDISLICFFENDNLKCCLNYDEALFDEKDMVAIKDDFLDFLAQKLPLSPVLQPLQLPEVRLFPSCPMLHQKVWAACELFESRTAVAGPEENLTYGELARRSKLLAHTLHTHLKPSEETVGIFDYPGVTAVTGITGILAAGRAFVPLDPDWPAGRVASIVAHAGLETIVAPAALLPLLDTDAVIRDHIRQIVVPDAADVPASWTHKVEIIRVEERAIGTLHLPDVADARRLAYVMYTSGTSGRPKGVMVAHEAVEVFLNWVAETFAIDGEDRFIHTSSLGFGGSIRQIFSTLLAGATIYPIPRIALKDPQMLYDFLEKHQITLLNTVPSVVNNLLEWAAALPDARPGSERLVKLRYVLLGGESLHAETVGRWRQFFGRHSTLVNLYGSTETIVNATAYFIDPKSPPGHGSVPIGLPKKGSQVRLVNDQGQLCAPGEIGQIFVGGPCLAQGYYREKTLTDEKFVHLDLPETEGIWYGTGDLARADENRLLHFAGRNDDQIQVYGNRVEPGEIEDVIYQTHQVKNVAVVDFHSDTQHRLAAFVELVQTGIKPTAQQIRDFIAEKLPAYMVPHRVIVLDRMPLNQAGKTDRVALRRMLAEAMKAEKAEEAECETSMTTTEMTIATVWRKLLQTNEIHREDDFFRLGGDSIMALEMLHLLRPHFANLPKAVTLFKDRKLAALAHAIDQLNAVPVAALPTKPATAVIDNRYPLSSSQKGFVLLKKIFPEASPNWAGLLELEGDFRPEVMAKTMKFLMTRHPMLRTVFVMEGAQTWQYITDVQSAPVQIFDIADQNREAQRSTLEAAFTQLQHHDFTLSQYPLYQIQLYLTGQRSGVLLICMHHIITDGWSTHILLNDLLHVYDQMLDGLTPDLGAAQPLYTDCLPLMNAAVSPEKLSAHTAYWQKALAQLPAFTPSAENGRIPGPPLSFILSADTRARLLHWSKSNGITLYNLISTLYVRALMRLHHTDDLLLNTAVNGRDMAVQNIQQIVGCFARNLPLRITFDRDADLFSCAKNIERIFFEALEHQDIPPTELFKITAGAGFTTAIFSTNRFYFSFMDFSALEKYDGRHLSLNWEDSTFAFNAGVAGSEMMMGVNVAEKIRITLNGYALPEQKDALKSLFMKEIDALFPTSQTIDTALIAYLPGKTWLQSMLPAAGTAGALMDQLLHTGRPQLLEWETTPFGVSGAVFLPFDGDELQQFSMERRVAEIRKAIQVAHGHGAKTISLAGTLPSLTNYGVAVARAWKEEGSDAPAVTLTTGHACTVVAVVKTIENVLDAAGISLPGLNVGVLGFGSIGQASLSLLLEKLGSPAQIIIADLETQLPYLDRSLEVLKTNFNGELNIVAVGNGTVPDDFYEADLIIGASSSGSVLDVARFRPGTILVDDSFPPAIHLLTAIHRMQTAGDVLLLGGGKLQVGIGQQQSFAPDLPEKILRPILQSLGSDGMPGCRAESILLHYLQNLPPTIGLVEKQHASQYWDACNTLEIKAVPLHLAGYTVPRHLPENVGEIIRKKQHYSYHE